jgi:hypothetical protein
MRFWGQMEKFRDIEQFNCNPAAASRLTQSLRQRLVRRFIFIFFSSVVVRVFANLGRSVLPFMPSCKVSKKTSTHSDGGSRVSFSAVQKGHRIKNLNLSALTICVDRAKSSQSKSPQKELFQSINEVKIKRMTF